MKEFYNKNKKVIFCFMTVLVLLFLSNFGYKFYKFVKYAKEDIVNNTANLNELSQLSQTNQELTNKINGINNNLNKLSNKINDSISNLYFKLKINGYETSVDLSYKDIVIYAKSLHTDQVNTVEIESQGDIVIKVNGEVYSGKKDLYLDTLSIDENILITIVKGEDFREIIIPTLPDGFPRYEIGATETTNLKGDLYGNFINNGNSYIYKMDMYGNLKYYYYSNKYTGSVHNFKKNTIGESVIYSFFEPVDDKNKVLNSGINFGEIVLLNDRYQEIDRLRMIPTEKVPQANYVENHDYIILDKDHYILLANVFVPFEQEDKSIKEMRCTYIQEIKNGKVVFDWLSSDYEELNNSYIELGDKDEDYMHTNSICIDKNDNNFIISNRNQDSVMKINRKNGNIIWTLGGKKDDYSLSSNQKFSRQHYAYQDLNGNLLLFNNGNNIEKSSIMMFELDEKNKKVKEFKSYEFGNKYSQYCGSVQHVSDDLILIGWGMTNTQSIATLYNINTEKVISELVTEHSFTYRTLYFE